MEINYLNFSGNLGEYIYNKRSREKIISIVFQFKAGNVYKKINTKRFKTPVDEIYIKNIDDNYLNNLVNWNFIKKRVVNGIDLYTRNPIISDKILDRILNIQLDNIYQEKTFRFGSLELKTYGRADINKFITKGHIEMDYSEFYTFILFNNLPFIDSYVIKNYINQDAIGYDLIPAMPNSIIACKKY